jgi:hypothetical protein
LLEALKAAKLRSVDFAGFQNAVWKSRRHASRVFIITPISSFHCDSALYSSPIAEFDIVLKNVMDIAVAECFFPASERIKSVPMPALSEDLHKQKATAKFLKL